MGLSVWSNHSLSACLSFQICALFLMHPRISVCTKWAKHRQHLQVCLSRLILINRLAIVIDLHFPWPWYFLFLSLPLPSLPLFSHPSPTFFAFFLQHIPTQYLHVVAKEYFHDKHSLTEIRDALLDLLGDVFFVVPGLVTARYHRGESEEFLSGLQTVR